MFEDLPDELVYFVAEQLIEKRVKATDTARLLLERYVEELDWIDIGDRAIGDLDKKEFEQLVVKTRPKVYDILREAIGRGFARLNPPLNVTLANRLAEHFEIDSERRTIRVVNARRRHANDSQRVRDLVTKAGAEEALRLIIRLGKKRQGGRVGVAFGAGHTTMNIARELAFQLSGNADCPPLTLHALTSGFSIDPRPAPVTFFRFFDRALVDIEYVPLFSAPTVQCEEYAQVKTQPIVSRAFEHASEIDIVITSLASRTDEHGLLNTVLEDNCLETRNRLQKAGWVGDVQFLPYSEKGPIELSTGIRAVTLFELSDLCRLAAEDDKYVILVAGPCNICGDLKTSALRPLLLQPDLRMWSHLVTDLDTPRALLEEVG